MTHAKCLVANGHDLFCVLGKLFCLDTNDECLRYLRPCTCETCTKALRIRRQVQKIAIATLEQRS
jgi:hypothetical protein